MKRNLLLTVMVLAAVFFETGPSVFAQVSVTAANPSSTAPGTVNLNVTISGSGFKKGAKSQFFKTGTTDPGDVMVNSTTFTSASQVVANINVSATAVDAAYDIQVMNTNGSSGKGTELFGVQNAAAPGQCSDIPVTITFAAGTPTGGSSGLFGDVINYPGTDPTDPFYRGTSYSDGVDKVYAKFQVCNSTNDLILNLNGTTRYLNFDFTQQVSSADPRAIYQGGTVWNGGAGTGFFNMNEVRNASLYTPDASGVPTFDTCMGTSPTFGRSTSGHNMWRNASQVGVVPGCENQGGLVPIANNPYPLSIIRVQRPDACTYIARALPAYPASSPTYPLSGLVEQVSKTWATGGQYIMPLLIKVTVNGCAP